MSHLPQLSTTTLADQAYSALRLAILEGGLTRGQKVTERGLADLLNISPTPVREAMRRLEQDRLVERRGTRSVRITNFDDEEIADISTIEVTLRALAARMAAGRANPDQLTRMAASLDAADTARESLLALNAQDHRAFASALDLVWSHLREFHDIVDAACGSSMLLHMLAMADAFQSGERRRVLREEIRADPAVADERYRQHRAIFDAINNHDEQLTEQLMRTHDTQAALPRLRSRGL